MSKIPKWLGLKPSRIVAVCLATGALLFLPSNWVGPLGLSSFTETYRWWIGAVFVVCIAVFIADTTTHPARHVLERAKEWFLVRDLRWVLHLVSKGEKEVLSRFLRKNTKTLGFAVTDGVVAGLEKQHTLVRATSVSFYQPVFQFGNQPWAWRYVHKHPEFVGLTRDGFKEGEQ